MNVLVVQPGRHDIAYSFFGPSSRNAVLAGRLEDYRGSDHDHVAVVRTLQEIRNHWRHEMNTVQPDVIAFRGSFGGTVFTGPTLADEKTEKSLRQLIPYAPLHIPALIHLLGGCREVFPTQSCVLTFDTSFFSDLPSRESSYGLDPSLLQSLQLRRIGYQGLFHEAAYNYVTAVLNPSKKKRPVRAISICLEPRPEVAAVIGRRPLMVTSGVTPLEGLPGQRTCGEIDPSIVLTLSNQLGWGPEQINFVLTQESGIHGLLDGRSASLDSLFESDNPEFTAVRDLIRYRILLACGSAIAVMGGVDTLVFSGRHASLGKQLGSWLSDRLRFPGQELSESVSFTCFEEPVDRIIADLAIATALGKRKLVSV